VLTRNNQQHLIDLLPGPQATTPAPVRIQIASRRDEILNLQCLRGFAAMLVIADHLLERMVNRGVYPREMRDVAWALGEVGVATFFAISGFIMVHTTSHQFGRSGSVLRFIRRRFLRVAPLYYVTTAAMIVFAFTVERALPSVIDVARSLAFVPYESPSGLMQPVYGLGWTLEYEMFFYLVFGLCLVFPARFGLTLVIGFLTLLVATGISMDGSMHTGLGVAFFYFSRPIILYFVIGIMVGLIVLATGAVSTRWLPDVALCAIGCAAVLLVPLLWPHVRGSLFGLPAVALALSLATLFKGAGTSPLFAGISRGAGNISYSLYLTHSFVLGGIAWALVRTPIPRLPVVGLPIAFCIAGGICVAVAWCTWRFVEQPLARACARLPAGPIGPAPRARAIGDVVGLAK
jgi:exopolysaccharide production protein ExoZ